jgi:3-isopropylmalate/(R)-2-methylmalate dehydratase large subunit
VTAKDVFLHIAGTYGEHATQNVEFGGPALPGLSISARKTLATMGAELSCEFATFEADAVLADYLRARGKNDIEPVHPDRDANYFDVRKIDLSGLEPLVALPDSVLRNSRAVGEVAGTRVDQAFIGSCANGTLDDLTLAARVLTGRKVFAKTRLIVTPGSQHVYLQALRSGVIATLAEAGAVITNPTCGACGGGHMGVLGPDEVCITASTRNFKGRMGDPSARIYMASPATVAASAIKGEITHPGEFLN